ncbi:MAG TPA: GTPase [Planctomycetes bacterium]|nr:GTPase [Planctomycetota bacterium]HIK81877.1 GTPase [Planctomycetota bacterium]
MVQINFALKEVNCKIVYYGPGLSGKTTNLEVVHQKAPGPSVGDLTSIATEGDRTLFFDFLPLNLGQVAGMKTKFQIYTVPGQVYYNSTRKLVLQGADGVVFVADSKRGKMDENIESLKNLGENLKEHGLDISNTPIVLQYNKRDLPDVYSTEEMEQALNSWNAPYFEAVARDGHGVFPTLKRLAGLVLETLNENHAPRRSPSVVSPKGSVNTGGGSTATTAVATRPTETLNATATSSPGKSTTRVRTTVSAVRTSAQAPTVRTQTSGTRPTLITSPRRRKRQTGMWMGFIVASTVAATVLLHLAGIIKIWS